MFQTEIKSLGFCPFSGSRFEIDEEVAVQNWAWEYPREAFGFAF